MKSFKVPVWILVFVCCLNWRAAGADLPFRGSSGEMIFGLGRFPDTIYFSTDKQLLALSTELGILVWNLNTAEVENIIQTEEPLEAALSPDGRFILASTMGYERVLRYDLVTGEVMEPFPERETGFETAAVSPDHSQAVMAIDGKIEIWDLVSGNLQVSFTETRYGIYALAYSNDSKTILSVDSSDFFNSGITYWDAATGQPIKNIPSNLDMFTLLSISPDDQYIATDGYMNSIKLWDKETGQLVREFTGHTHTISSIAFSGDGNYLVSGSYDDRVKVWEIETGREIRSFGEEDHNIRNAAFSFDDSSVFSVDDIGQVHEWNVETGMKQKTFGMLDYPYLYPVFLIEKDYLLGGTPEGSGVLWNLETGVLERKYQNNPLVVSANGDWFLTRAVDPDNQYDIAGIVNDHYETILMDVQNNTEIKMFPNSGSPVTFLLQDQRIITHYADPEHSALNYEFNTVEIAYQTKLWDIQSGTELNTFAGETAAVSADGEWILIDGFERTSDIIDINTGATVKSFPKESYEEIVNAVFSPDKRYLILHFRSYDYFSYQNRVELWDLQADRILTSGLPEKSLVFLPSSHSFLYGLGNEIHQYDIDTGQETIFEEPVSGFTDSVYSVVVSPDGTQFLAIHSQGDISVWDLQTERRIGMFVGHKSYVYSQGFSTDGEKFVSYGIDGTTRVWRKENMILLPTFVRNYLLY